MIDILSKQYIKLDDIERKNTALLHGKAGRVMAKFKFNVTDEDILKALNIWSHYGSIFVAYMWFIQCN